MSQQQPSKEKDGADSIAFNENLGSLTLKLNDGNVIPQIGLGTYLWARAKGYFKPSQMDKDEDAKQEEEFKNAVLVAVKNGYRHIDTAQSMYIHSNQLILFLTLFHSQFTERRALLLML